MQAPALLAARSLSKSFGEDDKRQMIIGDLTLSIRPGEFVSVVGPSGCGKTTLLMCLAGLMRFDGGELLFEGQRVLGPPAGVSVVFQDYSRSLLPWKRILDNVLFGMKRVKGSQEDKRARAKELLSAVGLAGFERHFPWQLSGGMQQRVAIARGLAAQPKLLLLDEPMAAVDAQTRAELQDLALELAKRFDQACLLVTHDVDEAVYMADRVVVLTKRPTSVHQELIVDIPTPRDQLSTREDPRYLALRHQVLSAIRSMH